ncbi:uncharacterized protein F5147DRAFT_779534 [Suillus discolor]|uniref:DUF6532 domain-containing protein n=1 Tax=Suillus discolor TaxID=1912936 RepID=A0A9P7EWX4_9AGAM|nr:uncharacterized protein F5147DRAFT_779534 [Suillus discolor]KAG2092794.1 hypothetical protein F5147DRAFT_779534 [Suillus discolor]
MPVSTRTSEWTMQTMEWISTKIWIDLILTMKLEEDEAYDVLKRHHAKNGQQKAPSPTYLSKGKGKEWARTFKLPGGTSTVQASPRRQSSQQDRYVRTSSSCTQSPLRRPSRPITSSSRSHTQPTSRRSSPPRSPSDPILPSSRERSRTSTPEDAHQSSNSKRKVKTNQEDPSKLGFYPPTWQTFLQTAKLEMRLQAVLATPVPESQEALNLAREVLPTVLWTYHEKKIKLERGYFLEYSTQMCRLLCNDLFTFRTELKKIVVSIAKRAYNIFPQGSTMLLKSGDYLRLPDSSGGNFKNFTVQALKDVCLEFYYSNSKKALKNTDEFHQTIPINAMLLVAAVLKGVISGFRETGTDKVPELTTEQCRAHFVNLQKSIDTLLDIPERREELEDMLEQWARIGMGDFNEYADGNALHPAWRDARVLFQLRKSDHILMPMSIVLERENEERRQLERELSLMALSSPVASSASTYTSSSASMYSSSSASMYSSSSASTYTLSSGSTRPSSVPSIASEILTANSLPPLSWDSTSNQDESGYHSPSHDHRSRRDTALSSLSDEKIGSSPLEHHPDTAMFSMPTYPSRDLLIFFPPPTHVCRLHSFEPCQQLLTCTGRLRMVFVVLGMAWWMALIILFLKAVIEPKPSRGFGLAWAHSLA